MKITKTRYLHIFTAIVLVLALYRCGHDFASSDKAISLNQVEDSAMVDTVQKQMNKEEAIAVVPETKNVVKPHKWHKNQLCAKL